MKKLLVTIAIVAGLTFPALAQYMPCVSLVAPPAELRVPASVAPIMNTQTGERGVRYVYTDGSSRDDFPSTRPKPEPQLVDAFSEVYKLNALQWWHITFYMPVAGRCLGKFASYDDRSDTYKIVQDAAGRYVRVPVETRGDVEILVITNDEWARIKGAIATSGYRAVYSTGRSYGGTFDVDLTAGWYHLIVYNGFSASAKSVSFTFGGKLPDVRP